MGCPLINWLKIITKSLQFIIFKLCLILFFINYKLFVFIFKSCDLEQWLNSDFEAGKLISLDHKKLLAAARDSLKRRHEIHVGIQHGALTTEVAGGSYLSKFNRKLNHINY